MTTTSLPLVISFYTHKGGVGKTTCIQNMANVLAAELNLKVLVVDMDPQASLTGVVMHGEFYKIGKADLDKKGIKDRTERQIIEHGEEIFYSEPRKERRTIYELFKGEDEEEAINTETDEQAQGITEEDFEPEVLPNRSADQDGEEDEEDSYNLNYIIKNFDKVKDQVKPFPIAANEKSDYLFIPGDLNLTTIEGEITEALALSESRKKFGQLFKEMPGVICRLLREVGRKEKVDLVLLDLNPGASGFNKACIMGSDYFIVPNLPDFYSRRSIASLSKLLDRWDKSCDFFRKKAQKRFQLPPCPKFLGQIINQVKVVGRDFTQDYQSKIDMLQNEIKSKLMKYMVPGSTFLTDPPIITEFTRLGGKVDEIGRPIIRADYDDIFQHRKSRKSRNMTEDQVEIETALHLNCYFTAVISIFNNLSNAHHRLLRNALRLDINKIFPEKDAVFEDENLEIPDQEGRIWIKHPTATGSLAKVLNPQPTGKNIAECLTTNIAKANLVSDMYSAFTKASNKNETKTFKTLKDKVEESKAEFVRARESLKQHSRQLGLTPSRLSNDPQLCKLSYCSDDKEESKENENKKTISECIGNYFETYIALRAWIAKLCSYLASENGKKIYISLVKTDITLAGDYSLKVYATEKKINLDVWVKNPNDGKPIVLHRIKGDEKDRKDLINILCETRDDTKSFTLLQLKPQKNLKSTSKKDSKNKEIFNQLGKRQPEKNQKDEGTKKKVKKN